MTDAHDDGPAVRIGFTGLGKRGMDLLSVCLEMDDVAVPAACDIQEENLERTREAVVETGRPEPDTFEDHGRMVEEADLDGVIVAPSWRFHVPMAIQAMEAGVVPGLDVGPANSVEECWDLVRTAERTGEHCMLLENGCYGRSRMAVLNMVREGLFGELVHCECGYCHDLRGRLNDVSGTSREDTAHDVGDGRYFRGVQHEKRNADLYPTHGVGPMAKCLDVHSGNRFLTLTSKASKAAGVADWAERNLPADHPSRDIDWSHGDVVSTIIECANGETLTVSHDVNLPRPDNSKRFVVRGTRGMWQDELDGIYLDERSPDHEWEDFEDYRDEYEHPTWESYLDEGVRGGHGGSDYLVLRDYVESIARDERPPIDVYDTAAWMAVSPLSEESIATGETVSFPDFTDGRWLSAESDFGLGDG